MRRRKGGSVVVLAKSKYGLRGREVASHEAEFIKFSAYTRMSGVDLDGRRLRKGGDRGDPLNLCASAAGRFRRA